MTDPMPTLSEWLGEAEAAGAALPRAMTLATADAGGRPSMRTVSLKRIDEGALVFSSALWTRKAREIAVNPKVSLLFHWPVLGRQAIIAGTATLAERELAEELFSERELLHQLQTVVSRQGVPIASLAPLREQMAARAKTGEMPSHPADWGAFRVRPDAVEFWREAPDRIHERRLHLRSESGWSVELLSP